jgi:UDP-N-acetylglucosamine--N-acetylmuramyl-(pentapeptide) pyrophosphoryl-undecaprenol N-acetylglucosamine transferase
VSHFLNQEIVASLPFLRKEKKNLRIFHQTGKKDFEWVKNGYAKHHFEEAVVAPYFFDMANYFQKSDLIISRAGATTIAELIASQKASLLVPFSQATDNHQARNAKELEKIGGAKVFLEEIFTPEDFTEKIFFFLKNRENISQMEKNLASLKKDKIADKISALCFELIENHS